MKKNIIVIGKISRYQGNKGEVRVGCYDDNLDRISQLVGQSVFAGFSENDLSEMVIENIRFQNKLTVFKFKGVDSITDAQSLFGKQVYLDRGDVPELAEDEFYVEDLVGSKVFSVYDNSCLGEIISVYDLNGSELLEVKGEDNKFLVPFHDNFIEEIDIENKSVKIKEFDGLIDLNKI